MGSIMREVQNACDVVKLALMQRSCSWNPTDEIRNITSRGHREFIVTSKDSRCRRRGIKPKLISNAPAVAAAPRDDTENVRWHDFEPPLSEKSFPLLVSLLFPNVRRTRRVHESPMIPAKRKKPKEYHRFPECGISFDLKKTT